MRALGDYLGLAFGALRANALRTALTLLGIIIGAFTVVAMMALTEGLRLRLAHDLNELGAGVFQVQKWPVIKFGRHDWQKYARRPNLTMEHVELLRRSCADCAQVGGEAWSHGVVLKAGEHESNRNVQMAGGTLEYLENNSLAIASGRWFDALDMEHAREVVVLGADVADVLFPRQDPLGRRVTAGAGSYTVVGTLGRMGATFGGQSKDLLAILPLPVFLARYGKGRSLNITVAAADPEHMQRAQDQVTALLRRARGLADQDENDFEIYSNETLQKMLDSLSVAVAAAALGICLISLLVGGIGIMNIMLVSVTQRTREIGIRKAVGARRGSILAQFLLEAVVLSLSGGAIGAALGMIGAAVVRYATDIPAQAPAWAVALALGVAATVGLCFGIYPAARAARLDPVEAMRAE